MDRPIIGDFVTVERQQNNISCPIAFVLDETETLFVVSFRTDNKYPCKIKKEYCKIWDYELPDGSMYINPCRQ